MDGANTISRFAAVSRLLFWGNKSHVTGLASTPIPTAAGMAINMVVLIACAVFSLAPSISSCPTLAEILGKSAEDIAEDRAMGILDITSWNLFLSLLLLLPLFS